MALPTQFYAVQDGDRFESLDTYRAAEDLTSCILPLLPEGWKITPSGYWSYCQPSNYSLLEQGWKLHIAGTTSTAKELLQKVVPVLVSENVAFKYCADLTMVRLSTSKNWDRTSSGKFMTIYPVTDSQAVHVASLCHERTRDLAGPYILTDRPYRDSRVVFYRYGGHRAQYRAEPSGLRVPVITAPDGTVVPDRRLPCFSMPAWATNPFPKMEDTIEQQRKGSHLLRDGRYEVEGAFRFSSLGGIYYGKELSTNRQVVIRELRPHLGFSPRILEKEARILRTLGPLGIAPAFIDLFEEQTHKFLVQERLVANNLWDRTIDMIWGDPAGRKSAEILEIIRDTVIKLIDVVEIVHSHRIVLRDLTRTNILFCAEDDRLKLIDFELAFELDGDESPIPGGTFGYRSPQQARNATPSFADDYFALGAAIIDLCCVTAAGLHLHPHGVIEAFRQTLTDLGLPEEIADIAAELTDPDPDQRPWLSAVRSRFESLHVDTNYRQTDPVVLAEDRYLRAFEIPSNNLPMLISGLQEGICGYIKTVTNLDNPDQLWPCSPDAFSSNGASFRFGAAGVLYYLHTVGAGCPPGTQEWLLRTARSTVCPVGLYSGIAGISTVMLSLGMTSEAVDLINQTDDDRVFEAPGLYEGAAGWGLTNLLFWKKIQDPRYLSRALKVACWLRDSAHDAEDFAYWEHDAEVHLGLGRGASGIGLFFLYLHAATGDTTFLDLATRAVSFDIANASWHGDRVLMHDIRTDDPHRMKTPGTFYGTAGVGTAVLRLFAVTREERLRAFAETCALTLSSRYTNKLWQDWGLAGCGEFLIDAARFLNEPRFLNAAYYLAQGIFPFQMRRPEGIAFPGSELLRISCDFGVGSAGIGIFFHRLLNPDTPRALLLDGEFELGTGVFSAPNINARDEQVVCRGE